MQPETILQDIVACAKKAGAFIKKERESFSYSKVEIKGLNDMVSYVDKTAEQMIVADLQNIFPEAGFIVEENTRSERRDYNWIVDPLDGTTNFVHGMPAIAVSIALEHHNRIVAGVVYEVASDECFYAAQGSGAFMNGKPIHVSQRKTLSESLIATGFPIYNFERMSNYLGALSYFMQHTHGLRRLGSAATDLCYVACGRMDAYFEYNLQPWDVAGGGIILQEAGGTICDFSGGDNWIFGRELSATNGHLHEEFNAVVQRFFQ